MSYPALILSCTLQMQFNLLAKIHIIFSNGHIMRGRGLVNALMSIPYNERLLRTIFILQRRQMTVECEYNFHFNACTTRQISFKPHFDLNNYMNTVLLCVQQFAVN